MAGWTGNTGRSIKMCHPETRSVLKWSHIILHRTTLSRRYKLLYPVIQAFIAFLGQDSEPPGSEMSLKHLNEDQSLFKAQSDIAHILRKRKTAIEPIFDLIARLIGTRTKQEQLFRQGIQNVRTHLGLGVLALQIAMISNQIWRMPFRTISHIRGGRMTLMHTPHLYQTDSVISSSN
ncbi:MAG: hypothetical protein ACPG7F_01365 [Aggregatilineales bacterium]